MATTAKVLGTALSSIAKICGTAKASIKKVNGIELVPPTPGLLDSYSESNQDDYWNDTSVTAGQAIALASSKTITSVKFYLKKITAPTGNIVAKVYSCSGTPGSTGVPTGSALATSDTVAISTLSTSFGLVEFTFSTPYTASAGGVCVSVEWSGTGGQLAVGIDYSSPSHAGNNYFNGAAYSTADTIFYLYGY